MSICTKATLSQRVDALKQHMQAKVPGSVLQGYTLGIPIDTNQWIFETGNSYSGVHRLTITKNGDLAFDFISNTQNNSNCIYGYEQLVKGFVCILAYLGYPVQNILPEQGVGILIEIDKKIYGFTNKLRTCNNTVETDGAIIKLDNIKEQSKDFAEFKKIRKEARPVLDLLVTTDILANITKDYTQEDYRRISITAQTILNKQRAGLKTLASLPFHRATSQYKETTPAFVKGYNEALARLAVAEDPINIFMTDTLPYMAGIFEVSIGVGNSIHSYPTMKGLLSVLQGPGHYNQPSTKTLKQMVRGVDRIAQFIEELHFSYRKITVYDKASIAKMV